MPKGPPPRVDLSKKGLEELKDSDLDEKVRQAQTLFLDHNKLTKVLPIFPSAFSTLKVLYLNHNNLAVFPEEICALPELTKIHIENNCLRTIPSSIGNLTSLRKLYLHNNELIDLPDEFGKLTCLEVLDIHNNNIKVLTPHLATSIALQELSIHNNPIESPPPFIYNKGMVHLLAYMREIKDCVVQDTPRDEFIFIRKMSFLEGNSKSKRTLSSKPFSRTQSTKIVTKEAAKAEKEIKKKGSQVFARELTQDSLPIQVNQNHLLYFLTEHGICELQGRRDYMEDRCTRISRLHQQKSQNLLEEVVHMFSKIGFYGVYDGHGGARCADYLQANLHKNICNTQEFLRGDFEEAIRKGFQQTDEEFLQMCRNYHFMDGSTSAIAMLIDNKLITAHAGDSRCVLCRDKKAVRLTEDHKPDRVDELTRIEERGGEVIFRGNCFRVSGDLAMSRSFGDLRLKEPQPLVISEPEIRVEELTPKDQFIIIASDGLWDVLSDQKAVDVARKCLTTDEAAKRLADLALAMGSMDNTSVVVIKLNWALDFLTQDEIEGRIGHVKEKTRSHKKSISDLGESSPVGSPMSSPMKEHEKKDNDEISEERLERTRSTSFSFRDSLEGIAASVGARKSIYLPVTQSAIKLRVLIPELSATKLMKFDNQTQVSEIVRVLMQKHRFPEEDFQQYSLVHKGSTGEVVMNNDKTIEFYNMKDSDEIELRRKGESNTPPRPIEEKVDPYNEALPPSQPTQPPQSIPPQQQVPPQQAPTPASPSVSPVVSQSEPAQPRRSTLTGANRQQDQVEESFMMQSTNPSALKRSLPPTPVRPAPSLSLNSVGNPISTSLSPSKIRTESEPPIPNATAEKSHLLIQAYAFKLKDKSWIPLDAKKEKCKVAIVESSNSRFRIVALSSTNEYVINAWIRPERDLKKNSALFCVFSTLLNRESVHFGLSFASSEDTDSFVDMFHVCLEKLKLQRTASQTQLKVSLEEQLEFPHDPQNAE